MKRFKLFLAATLLCVAVAGFSAFKVSEKALPNYYYFIPATDEDPSQCLFAGQLETDCLPNLPTLECETPTTSYRIYAAINPEDETQCQTPLFRPIE